MGTPVLTDLVATDFETHAAATDAVLPHLPLGNMYVASNKGTSRSTDGGLSWTRVGWDDVVHQAPRCQFVFGGPIVLTGGDPDIKATRAFLARDQQQPSSPNPVLQSYPAYASFLFKRVVLGADQIVLYHTGLEGALVDSHAQCHVIDVRGELGPAYFADKSAIALVEGTATRPAALWVTWQWWGYSMTPPRIASNFYTVVPLEALTGDFLPHLPPRRLNNPGEDVPTQPAIDWGVCTPPPGGVDHAGRGNLFADVDGNVYLTYSNNPEFSPGGCSVTETRRIYVRRLTSEAGKLPFHTCIDQIDATTDCATKAPIIEENDPTIVVDPLSGLLVVSYLSQPNDLTGEKRVTLAWSQDGKTWTRDVVDPDPSSTDQAQPALAVTTSFDPLDRVPQGTYFLTWYEETSTLVPLVERRAMRFNSAVQALEPSFAVSDKFFPRDFNEPLVDTSSPRGVHEYQGVAHAPGANKWYAAWSAPRDALDPDLRDVNFGIWTNTVEP